MFIERRVSKNGAVRVYVLINGQYKLTCWVLVHEAINSGKPVIIKRVSHGRK